MTAVEDTDPHHGKEVVSSVRVVVNATEKRCRPILANHLGDEMPASWVLIHKVGNIVNKSRDQNQRSLGRLFLV